MVAVLHLMQAWGNITAVLCHVYLRSILMSMQACLPIACEVTHNIVGSVHHMCTRASTPHLQLTAVLISCLIQMSSMSAMSYR